MATHRANLRPRLKPHSHHWKTISGATMSINEPLSEPVSRRLFQALTESRNRLEAQEYARTEPIAVIGIGCRFPGGARSPDAFWRLLRDGVDAVATVPVDRWDASAVYDPSP